MIPDILDFGAIFGLSKMRKQVTLMAHQHLLAQPKMSWVGGQRHVSRTPAPLGSSSALWHVSRVNSVTVGFNSNTHIIKNVEG